ncbi:MAG: hypothetical protein E4H10_17385 [Bacteroidia bacterium]|nr:MAG: hypothetical protein E4H10_17385 [Bacteroidia bacterium]
MKRLLTLAFSILLVCGVAAQNEQKTNNSGDSRTMWLGGQVAFGSMSNLDLTIGPNFGIMVGERIGVGGALIFSSGNNAFEWGIEPYFRYYIPIVDRFSFYGDAFVGVGGGDNNTNIDGGDYFNYSLGARLGLQYWFSPSWSVAASNNVFSYESIDGDGELGVGLIFSSVNLSLFWHF